MYPFRASFEIACFRVMKGKQFKSKTRFKSAAYIVLLEVRNTYNIRAATKHAGNTTYGQHNISATQHMGNTMHTDNTTSGQHNIRASQHTGNTTYVQHDIRETQYTCNTTYGQHNIRAKQHPGTGDLCEK